MAQRPDVPGYPGLPELSGGHLVVPRQRSAGSPPVTAEPPLPGSLGERLRAARDRVFVGRDRELAAFRAALRDGGVLYLHGAGGVGKTTLLRRLADEARDAGRTVIEVDCRTIVPTPAGFSAEVPVPAVRLVPGSGPAPVLLVDGLEHCRGLAGWLREVFLPGLPAGTTTVIAGREPVSGTTPAARPGSGPEQQMPPVSGAMPPSPHAFSVAEPPSRDDAVPVDGGDAVPLDLGDVVSLGLGDLGPAEAARLLEVRGVAAVHHQALLSFTGGHPLALSLAATLPADALPPAGAPWRPAPEVLASLLGALIGEVPSPAHRRALEVCAHAPHTTAALLSAVVDAGPPAADLLNWLRRLPFAGSGPGGVTLHEMVREAVDADLRWRDPAGYERMHRAVGAHLLDRVRAAGGPADSLAATGAVAHLQRYGPMAEWLTLVPRHGPGYEDALRPGDHDAIVAMTRAAEGDESAAVVAHWLRDRPASFHVHRRASDHAPTGFLLWLRLPVGDPDAAAADPVTAAAWAHAERTRPLGAGEHLGLARFMIDSAGLSHAMRLLQLRVYATWIRSDRLAWSYVPSHAPATWERPLGLLGHRPTGATAQLGGRRYALFGCDWRVTPQDVWFGLAAPATTAPAGAAAGLARPDFDTAVREALRDFHRPGALAASPLLRTRMVTGGAGDPVDALRELLTDAVDELRDDPREARLHRVLATTFFHRLPTQVAAAERLGLSFSTYRRRLHRGLDRVGELLWQRESGG